MNDDQRLVDIEIKLTRQEDLVDTLNQTIYRQQKQIDELQRACEALAISLKQLQDAASDRLPANERPPHY